MVTLVGFTLYMTGAIGYNIFINGRENKKRIAVEQKRQAAIAEQERLDDIHDQKQ